jgi:hypothetical protein
MHTRPPGTPGRRRPPAGRPHGSWSTARRPPGRRTAGPPGAQPRSLDLLTGYAGLPEPADLAPQPEPEEAAALADRVGMGGPTMYSDLAELLELADAAELADPPPPD